MCLWYFLRTFQTQDLHSWLLLSWFWRNVNWRLRVMARYWYAAFWMKGRKRNFLQGAVGI